MTKLERGTAQKAVIYCRVASATKTELASQLAQQEKRCREYAKARGYDVVAVYNDHVSGIIVDRPGMRKLLAQMHQQGKLHGNMPVVVDDLGRSARSITGVQQLRQAINAAGGTLEIPRKVACGNAAGEAGMSENSHSEEDADDKT